MRFGVQRLSNKRLWTAMDIQTRQPAFPPDGGSCKPFIHSFGEELRCSEVR
jgi:hypothetical protein